MEQSLVKIPSSSEDEDESGYLISKALDSVTKSTNKNLIESFNHTGEGFNKKVKKDQDSSRKSDGSNPKRQLNLSVRVKEGKASFKAAAQGANVSDQNNLDTNNMPRIDSMLEEAGETTDDRIESRLISDNRKQSNSSQ